MIGQMICADGADDVAGLRFRFLSFLMIADAPEVLQGPHAG